MHLYESFNGTQPRYQFFKIQSAFDHCKTAFIYSFLNLNFDF